MSGIFQKVLTKLGLGKKDDTAKKPTSAAPSSAPARPVASSAPAARPVHKPTPVEMQKKIAEKPHAIAEVDVVKQLEKLAKGKGLNWKVSIVDLLTLLEIDSSRAARNELATELGCPEEFMSDSAKMNTWLHKTVLKKIAENGGNIPKELLD